MPLFTQKLNHSEISESISKVKVPASRILLQKKRWRTTAENGDDIAVDLEVSLSHGDYVGLANDIAYIIDQAEEEVIVINIPDHKDQAATIGWMLGNQHIPVEVRHGTICVAYDKGVAMLLDRNEISYTKEYQRFSPSPHSHTHSHGHNHSHD